MSGYGLIFVRILRSGKCNSRDSGMEDSHGSLEAPS